MEDIISENEAAMAALQKAVKELGEIEEGPVINGLRVSVIEKRYRARYVGFYSIPGIGDGPYLVFYTDNPDTSRGHDNYFGIWRNPRERDDIRILNAGKIRNAQWAAIQLEGGGFLVSRSVHGMVSAPNGAFLDGGPFYTRHTPDHPPTHLMTIVKGIEVFVPIIKESKKIAAELPIIDTEFKVLTPSYEPNGMSLLLSDVGTFHDAVDQPVRDIPKMPSQDEIDFRIRLIDEEYLVEFKDACASRDIVAAADALGDIVYVVLGTALHFGIPLDRVWAAIQASNMAKIDPVTGKVRKRADGKVLKPEGWQPPNIEHALFGMGGSP